MAFKKYEKNSRSACPTITITPNGSIGINTAAMDSYFKSAKGLELYYDPESNRIGIKPYDKIHDNLYPIHQRGSKGTSGCSLSGKGFLKHFGIEIDELQKFIPAWNKKEALLEIHLESPITTENIEKIRAVERRNIANNSTGGGIEL